MYAVSNVHCPVRHNAAPTDCFLELERVLAEMEALAEMDNNRRNSRGSSCGRETDSSSSGDLQSSTEILSPRETSSRKCQVLPDIMDECVWIKRDESGAAKSQHRPKSNSIHGKPVPTKILVNGHSRRTMSESKRISFRIPSDSKSVSQPPTPTTSGDDLSTGVREEQLGYLRQRLIAGFYGTYGHTSRSSLASGGSSMSPDDGSDIGRVLHLIAH